jgi:hypothetical protein
MKTRQGGPTKGLNLHNRQGDHVQTTCRYRIALRSVCCSSAEGHADKETSHDGRSVFPSLHQTVCDCRSVLRQQVPGEVPETARLLTQIKESSAVVAFNHQRKARDPFFPIRSSRSCISSTDQLSPGNRRGFFLKLCLAVSRACALVPPSSGAGRVSFCR